MALRYCISFHMDGSQNRHEIDMGCSGNALYLENISVFPTVKNGKCLLTDLANSQTVHFVKYVSCPH